MKLHPNYPVVENEYQMTKDWSIVLEGKFNRRFEDDNLVIWRTGLTFWISVIGQDDVQKENILEIIKEKQSETAKNMQEKTENNLLRYQYEITENDEKRKIREYAAIYSFTIKDESFVQCAAYCDTEDIIAIANKIIMSIHD